MTEPEISGWDCSVASFEYEARTGLTIALDGGSKMWLSWDETKDFAGWLVDLVLKDSQ
jgi:hypothetical protein